MSATYRPIGASAVPAADSASIAFFTVHGIPSEKTLAASRKSTPQA